MLVTVTQSRRTAEAQRTWAEFARRIPLEALQNAPGVTRMDRPDEWMFDLPAADEWFRHVRAVAVDIHLSVFIRELKGDA
jgi:hypothetical protein